MTDSRDISTTELISRSVNEILKGVGTVLPATIDSFDPSTQLATVKPSIQLIDIDGNPYKIAPTINVPVHFLGGSAFQITFEIATGDEGIILISQRCIDAWKEQGGDPVPPIIRKFDFQDALFLAGFRSKPNAIADFQNDGIMMRDAAGTNNIWLKNSGDIEVNSDAGNVTVNALAGDVEINCVNFNVNSTTFTHNGVDVGDTHTHAQPNTTANATVQGNTLEPIP